jgi:hypothetical protein
MKSGETTASDNSTCHAHFERIDRHILPFGFSAGESTGRSMFLHVDHHYRGTRCPEPRVSHPFDSINALDEGRFE